MKRTYQEIMDHITVTPALRRRVLAAAAREDLPARSAPAWKKYLAAAACLVLLLAGAALLRRPPDRPAPPELTAVADIVEAASLSELSRLVGFPVTADFTLPFTAESAAYTAYWGELAQITYRAGEQTAVFRQSPGTADSSGDYNAYGDTAALTVGGLNVTLKGDRGIYRLALWTEDGYAFSLSVEPGMTAAAWRDCLAR